MRKQFLLLLIFCLAASLTWAERIDVATARKVAESVAQREGATSGLRSAGELPLVYAAASGQSGSALRSGTMEGAADYFVFNFPGGKGFAIVAGDDRVRPVLGYSDEGGFDPDNLPENLRGMLAYYQDQITWANDKDIEATPDIAAEWSRLMSGTALRAAGNPVLLKTANWGQSEPYNRQTPTINGRHAVTGCVATAMGIIMHFHEYPEQAMNPPASNVYKINNAETSSQITYGAYDWGNMLDAYSSVSYNDVQANAVSTLLWHCGANVYMNYGLGESGANTPRVAKALSEVFGYSPSIRFLAKEAYRWTEWKTMLKSELDADYPVIYDGQSQSGGHAFICDGYNNEDLYHINWGWNGSSNGFYVLSLLDDNGDGDGYSEGQGMILNIRPEQTEERYYVRPYLTSASYSKNGLSASVSYGLRYYALEDHDFYMGLGVVDQNNQIVVTPTSPKIMNLAAHVGGWTDYGGIQRSINLSADLSAGQRITLLCSLDGTNWEVMRALEDVPAGIDNNGVINPTPDDPNDPEQPLNAGIYWNDFDTRYLPVTGLDNNKYNSQNTQGISYSLTNAKENVIIRYTLNGYTDWAGKLDIYTGEDYTLYEPNKGEKVMIDASGSFEVTVLPGQIEYKAYVNYLKVLSDKAGELTYDIQVFSESKRDTPAFERSGNKMLFLDNMTGVFDKNPIRGTVNQEIPFAIHFTGVAEALTGKPLKLLMSIQGAKKGQIQLFDAQGKEILLEAASGNDSFLSTTEYISIGTLAENTPYSFKIKSNMVFQAPNTPYLYIDPYVDDKWIPNQSYAPKIIIDPVTVKTYTVTLNSSDLRLANTQNVIEEGEEFAGQLLCEKVGYRLPASIVVTMGGTTLVAGTGYTYDSTNGRINIPAIAGDVVITANAEPIPAVTYTIKAGQMIGATSDIPSGGLSVNKNAECTIKLTAEPGYLIKKADVIIKTADKTLQQGEDYTYTEASDYKNGTVKIHAVTADMELFVYAKPEPKSFTITHELASLTCDKKYKETVTENAWYEFTLTPDGDYRLPDAIEIYCAGVQLVQGADKDYTYDKTSGKVVIFKVTSDLVVKASGIDNSQIQVVFKLEGVIATPDKVGPFTIHTKPEFEVAFAAAEGYEYDGKIEVRMGDKLLSTPADYEYVPENDLPFTLKTPLTAALTITAKAVKKQYPIIATLTGLTSDLVADKKMAHGDPLAFKITPNTGYNLPQVIKVNMGGMLLTAGEGYTYNKATGEVSIAKVTGNVEVTAEAVLKQYDVKLNLTALTSNFTAGKIGHGLVLEMQLSVVSKDFQLPKKVTVKMNDQEFTDYKYENGKIRIAKVLGPIEITAVANKIYYVDLKPDNITIEAPRSVVEGETLNATLKVVSGYQLPYAISVTMNGRALKAGEYSYDNVSGKIEVTNVNGPITIWAVGIKEDCFEVVLNLANLTSDPASFEPQAKDSKIELTLKPSSGYELPSGFTVKMGDATLAAGTDYAYDRSTGKFTLEKITGTLVITATGSRIPEPEPEPEPTPVTYTVTLPVVEGATIAATGSTTVEEGNSLSFTVEVKAGYIADNMVVKANGTTLTPDANGRYTVANIRSNVVVTVTGIVKGDNPTANETIDSDELRIWAANGRLFIQTPAADTAYIVTFDGRVYKTLSLSAGEYSEQMPQGSYIIHVGKRSYKLNF